MLRTHSFECGRFYEIMKARRIISFLLVLIGIGCLLYPLVSNYINGLQHTYTFNIYEKVVAEQEDYSKEFAACYEYNRQLRRQSDRFVETEERMDEYQSLLNISQGMMGYIEIPKINVHLPIFHGSSKAELSQGVGHLFGSSLPVGGIGTHSVLAGHTGLANQILFNDLVELEEGDCFYIRVYDKTLTYEVDQIEVVEPTDSSLLGIDKSCDYVTLLTCYPMATGSHRLLVRGHNIGESSEKPEEQIITTQRVVTTTDKINWAFIAAGTILVLYFLYSTFVLGGLIKAKRKRDTNEKE